MRVTAVAAALFLVALAAGYGSSGGATEASGSATLKSDPRVPNGSVLSISCGAPGDCAAGGNYRAGRIQEAFVVSEKNGSWGKAIEVPGTATLSNGGKASVESVSCAAAGACVAGGYYTDDTHRQQAFVVSETNGRWRNAIEVPGTAARNRAPGHWNGVGAVNAVSCAAADECTAGGASSDSRNDDRAFVVDESKGSWGKAIAVAGAGTLGGGGGFTLVNAVSCAAVGDCTAGGNYYYPIGLHGFVVSETNGSWGAAIDVPGTAALDPFPGEVDARVDSLACAAAGDCAVGGPYWDGQYDQLFVVDETNGSWSNAIEVPGWAALKQWDPANVGMNSVSCGAAGDCAAGGVYSGGSDLCDFAAFVVSEANGSWGDALRVPGTGCYSQVESVSCAAAGDCVAGGYDADGAFVADEKNASWGSAITVPGPMNNEGTASDVNSVSCAAPGDCAAGGDSPYSHAFVVSEANGSWSNAIEVRFAHACVVPSVTGSTISVAETMLTRAHCGLGKIAYVYADWKKGLVLDVHPIPGRILPPGTPVALTLSKGPKP